MMKIDVIEDGSNRTRDANPNEAEANLKKKDNLSGVNDCPPWLPDIYTLTLMTGAQRETSRLDVRLVAWTTELDSHLNLEPEQTWTHSYIYFPQPETDI